MYDALDPMSLSCRCSSLPANNQARATTNDRSRRSARLWNAAMDHLRAGRSDCGHADYIFGSAPITDSTSALASACTRTRVAVLPAPAWSHAATSSPPTSMLQPGNGAAASTLRGVRPPARRATLARCWTVICCDSVRSIRIRARWALSRRSSRSSVLRPCAARFVRFPATS